MKDLDLKEPAQALREWKAPTLMIFDVKGRTRNFINPAPAHDSSATLYTAAS